MTTNAGARELSSGGMGFRNSSDTKGKCKRVDRADVYARIQEPPGRVGAVQGARLDVIKMIVDKFINELNGQLAEKRVIVKLEEPAREWLATNGFDSRYGARPMARLIHEKIKQPLANEILFGELANGGSVSVTTEENELKLKY
jgi:ATP-dependent Clp protease ATP-binding subunit ClpA